MRHLTSTGKAPGHSFCSQGNNSWCFDNRTKAKNGVPQSRQSKTLNLDKLNFDSLEHIRSVYRDLSSPDLLWRCLKKWTQWLRCHKIKHAGNLRATFATHVTVVEHNFSYDKFHLGTSMFGTKPYVQKWWNREKKENQCTAEEGFFKAEFTLCKAKGTVR